MKILLVEDNAADAALLEKQLSETGAFEVNLKRCRSIHEAEALSNDEKFDVVLLDVDLPDNTGLAAVRHMQLACPQTPILALSAEDSEHVALAALSSGAEDYLVKGHCPVDVLAGLISAAVERFSASGWDGKLQRLAVPENPSELARFGGQLRPIIAADTKSDTRTAMFAARIERALDRAGRVVDIDHCVFVVGGVGAAEDIDSVTEALTETLSVPIIAGRDRIRTRVSLGIAVSPDDASEPAELLAKALYALGGRSNGGSGRWTYYSDALNRRSAHRQRLLVDVRRAIDRDMMHLQYQPIVDARLRIAVRLEALLRWTRADGFVTSAATFMPFVEENGLVQRVDEYVIDRVGRQIRDWQIHSGETLPVSLNVSARSLGSDALVRAIAGMLERYAIDPQLLEIEITESSAIADMRRAAGAMSELRALEIGVALDDFGCAYASLDYLRHLPVSRLKIDKTFVRDIDDRRTSAVIRAIIDMAHTLDMRVTGEGVESERHAQALTELGCDELQGFFFARPCRPTRDPTPAALKLATGD